MRTLYQQSGQLKLPLLQNFVRNLTLSSSKPAMGIRAGKHVCVHLKGDQSLRVVSTASTRMGKLGRRFRY